MNNRKTDKRAEPPRRLRFLSPLHRANRQTALHLEGALADLGVSAPEAHLVAYIGVYGPCPIGELVRVFGYKRPTMTSMLDRLEERGLIERKVNPEDRRSFVVGATRAGGGIAAASRARVELLDDEIDRRVTSADRQGFENVMRAVAEVTGVEVRREATPTHGRKASDA